MTSTLFRNLNLLDPRFEECRGGYEVLVEGEHKGKWRGRTPGNKLVFFADQRDWIGKLADTHAPRAYRCCWNPVNTS